MIISAERAPDAGELFDDERTFYGVINDEGQYRLWPIFADVVQRGQQARADA